MKWNFQTIIHDGFEVGIFLKAVYAVGEVAGSGLIFLVKPERLSNFLYRVTANQLQIEPHDWLANQLVNFANSYSVHTQIYGAIYLFSHGAIKIFLVVNLWRRRLWAYPTAIVVFILFVVYQVYAYEKNHSLPLLLFTVLDLAIIALTYLEYQQIKKLKLFKPQS